MREKIISIEAAPEATDVAAAVAIFVVALIVLAIIGSLATRKLKDGPLGLIDRSLGLLFGLVRGVVLVSLVYLLLDWTFPATASLTGSATPERVRRSSSARNS